MEFKCEGDWDKLKQIIEEAPKEVEYIEFKGKKYIKEEYCIMKSKIRERIEQLNKGIEEFKRYVNDSQGEEKQFYKKQLGQLVNAKNELQELLEEGEK